MSRTDEDIEDLPDDWECHEGEEEGDYDGFREEQPIVYNSEDFISGPIFSKRCTIPENILEFHHSYGYDCKRFFNLVVADEETILFASGNFINFFNLNTKEIWFRRSAYGWGIGHIAKNTNEEYQHIAIAENGINPPIIIYEWPSLDIAHVLKGGTSRIYMHLHYSPDGMLLASQGGEPDHMITVWNWPKSQILLRTKSYVSDVHRVMFSPYVPGHLSSSGLSHIKFWKMASTFTGLKLQGSLGRFGKTEYTDILGIYGMPDEKVISGSSWGNVLIWDAGLIKTEVCRMLRKRCHDGPIVQFDYKDGELWTVAMDGRVRVWTYETIDQADPPDDDRVVQIEPTYDFHSPNVEFMCIYKQLQDPEDDHYIAQDGNGGIWRIDLTTKHHDVEPSVQLFKCHSGRVVDIAPCPWSTFVATLGEDGRLYMYNYLTMALVFNHQFPAKGRAMIWLPLFVQPSGDEIIMAFDDGNLRVVVVTIDEESSYISMKIIQIIKPHNKSVTVMSMNKKGTMLITGGEDSTIFVFQVHSHKKMYTNLIPIGFVAVPGIVSCLEWHCEKSHAILVGCIHGHIVQITVPDHPQSYTKITYVLHVDVKNQRFITYKSQIRRDIKIAEIEARKEKKRDKKREEMEKVKKENPGLEIDEEIFLADSESEEELEPLFIPEVPNRVLWMQSTHEKTVWLSMAGFDAGYIYEYDMDQKDDIPLKFQIIYDGDDTEISSFVYNYNRKYLFLAMENGQIRIVKVNTEDFRDLRDYWQLSMHDSQKGFIPRMTFSFDERIFFTCGYDGNIFSYMYNPEEGDYLPEIQERAPAPLGVAVVEEIEDYATLSLEETIVKAEVDRQERVATAHKNAVLHQLKEYREQFEELLERNENLPHTQIIPRDELEIDPRITKNLDEIISAELALEKRKLAFQVEKSNVGLEKLKSHFTDPLDVFPLTLTGINKDILVYSIKQRKLSTEFYYNLTIVEQKIIESELKARPPEREKVVLEAPPPPEKKEKQLEYFLLGLSPSTISHKLGVQLKRTLTKYRMRKAKLEKRQTEWDHFNSIKPVEGINHPDDIAAFNLAVNTIGDYKLKSALDYKVPPHLRENKVKKYKQLLHVRKNSFDMRHDFNMKVYAHRDRKVELIEYITKKRLELLEIQREIPEGQWLEPPPIPEISCDHFQEKNIVVHVELPADFEQDNDQNNITIIQPPNADILEREVLPYVDIDIYEETLETPWELELRTIRLEKKLFVQSEMIKDMNNAIKQYDEDLEKIIETRLDAVVHGLFYNLHILSLHQELIVLRNFEAHEESLSNNVNAKTLECLDMQDVITEVNNKIEAHKACIDVLLEKEKDIQQEFFTAILDNKFYDFLRKIFKKKYKPPKVHNPDESDSDSDDSDSSESEEEDAGSVDSRDFGIIKLDDSVCPKGCDKHLYEMTFTLRGQRHGVELEIKDERNSIEMLKKDQELNTRKLKTFETNLIYCQEELEAFQREKQRKLNEVNSTVVVKLHQLQHFDTPFELLKIWDTLLFSKATLSKLYKRVGQLQVETLQQKAKHKVNITHLQRMATDCKHMTYTIEKLKDTIIEEMTLKFGKVIDIDELEEAFLRKLVIDLRLSQTDIKGLYEEEMRLWKRTYAEKQIELADTIKENTAKLDLLVVLTRERTELAQLLRNQIRKKQLITKVIDIAEICSVDIQKLVVIIKNQKKHLQDLNDEIKTLRTKGMPVKAQQGKPPVTEHEKAEEDVDSMEWMGYDEYVKTEYEYRPEFDTGESKMIVTHLPAVPSVMSEKSEDMAMGILLDMLEEFDFESPNYITSKVLRELLVDIMDRSSVAQIINDILSILPIPPTDEQISLLEITAEKLYSLQEPEISEEDMKSCAIETIVEIIDEALAHVGDPNYVMTNVMMNLVQQIPIDYLLDKCSISCILHKMKNYIVDMDKDELINTVGCHCGPLANELKKLLNSLLEAVFGTGIDYLYVIPDI